MGITTLTTTEEVFQILALQSANHASVLSTEAMAAQGFVTVKHDPDVLLRMNQDSPAIIAKDEDVMAGYALVMPRSFAADVPVLAPMFAMLDGFSWKGEPLRDNPRWFVMGQICVAENYRGKGIFDALYAKMKEEYNSRFDFVLTEVAERNVRSMRAHERVGFQTLHVYPDDLTGEIWHTIIWDWSDLSPEKQSNIRDNDEFDPR